MTTKSKKGKLVNLIAYLLKEISLMYNLSNGLNAREKADLRKKINAIEGLNQVLSIEVKK